MHRTHPTTIDPSVPPFDKLSFVKYVKDIGREYRQQAIKLVSICRTFAQAQAQTRSSYNEFRSVLQVVDDALYSVTEARKKATKDADAKFKKATDTLSAYEKKYHFKLKDTVACTMAEAKANDKSSSTVLKRLKEKWRPLEEGPTKIVEFLLHKSLPDENPITVKQVLSQSSDTKEIMWNFSRYKDGKRLTLKDNPHFYEKLPTSAEKYEGQFRTDPVETFQQETISVLTDNPGLTGRLFVETAKEKRAFGNVWVPKEAIIFKDVCGKLEGENIIGSAITNTPNLWCFEEPSLSNASLPSLPDRSSLSPTTTATPTTSPTGALLGNWREPILRMLRSQGVKINIRISDKSPTSCVGSNYSEPSLPSPMLDSCNIVDSLSPTPQSRPTLGIQIPGASRGPQSPSSYKTARSTPLAQQPPAVDLSPRSPLFTEPPILPTPVSDVAPPTSTGPAVPDPTLLHDTSSREVPRVDVIPPQADTATMLPTPISTADPLTGPAVPDPTTCLLPDASLRELPRVDPIPPQAGTATILPQPHIGEPHAETREVGVPATRPTVPFGGGVTATLANDFASGLITPPNQQAVDPAPPPPKPKRLWYQKCFEVVKNALRPGLS